MLKEGKSILNIMVISLSSKVFGFVREITLAATFGVTSYTDAYLISRTITLTVFSIVGGALSTTFIPLYTKILEEKNKEEALKFTNNILNIVILLTIIICILIAFFIRPIVNMFAMGFKGEALELAIDFTKMLLPGVIIISINYILTGYLEANKKFAIPALMTLPNNIIIIISIILSSIWSKNILIYGTLLGLLFQLLFQAYYSFKIGYLYKTTIKLSDTSIKRLLYLIVPVFAGMAIQQVNVIVDRTLASTLVEGSIAALNFADRLNLFVYGVFASSIATVLYPTLSKLATNNDIGIFKSYIRRSVNLMVILLVPISIGAISLSTPIVRLLFERGQFDIRATKMTSVALNYYALGMTGVGLIHILTKIFYSLHDTKTPMVSGIVAVIINIILNFILIRYIGHGGLALATSISAIFSTLLLLLALKDKIGSFQGKKILDVFLKVSIASLLMGTGVRLFYCYISKTLGRGSIAELINLFLAVLVGIFIYSIQIIFLKIEEVDIALKLVKDKLKQNYF